MARSESRLWMVAPGWKPEVERLNDPPVTLIDFSPNPQASAVPVDRFALAVFFKQHGLFRKGQGGTVFEANGLEVILQESEPGEGVSAIRLTFSLADSSDTERMVQWQAIVVQLAGTFAFRLLDPTSLQPTSELDVLTALAKMRSFQ